jgi:hypothetical protein
MTQIPEGTEHPSSASSRPATPRPSSESYTAHLRNISRQSLEAELLHIPPAALSPPSTPRLGSLVSSTPRLGSPALHSEPHNALVHQPYRPTPVMVARPASQPQTSGGNTPIAALSPLASRPQIPRCTTPTATTPVDLEKPPIAISPSTHPPPMRSYQPDPFEHRTRWSMSGPKHTADSGYCCGLCDEQPVVLALCGSWLTGTMTALLAGLSMACCAAALR